MRYRELVGRAVGIGTALALIATSRGASTEVNLWVGRNVAPSSKIRVQLNTRNVPRIHVALYAVEPVAYLKRFDDAQRKRPAVQGRPMREWDLTVARPEQVRRYPGGGGDQYYSRQTNLPNVAPGVYLVSATGGGKEAWGVVNVTHLAVVAKRSPKRMLVWVTDALKGTLLSGAKIAAYDRAGKQVATGLTGGDGVCLIAMKPGGERIIVSRGKDYAGVYSEGMNPDGALTAHFQTDRPIYRPGQTVKYRVVLRRTQGQIYKNLVGADVRVELMDPKDNVIDLAFLKANGIGSVAGSFELPSEGMVGDYTLRLVLGKEDERFAFEVQEYRKPEYKVAVTPAVKRYLAGEEATVNVDAQYYFGAPVPQAQVTYRVERVQLGFYGWGEGWNDYGDGNLYARDTYRANAQIAADTVYTDKDGKVAIKFKTDPNAPDSSYNVSIVVQDASRRQASSQTSVPVYSAALRLAMRTDMVYASLGSLVPVQVRASDVDGRPVGAKVTFAIFKPVWVEKEGRYKQVLVADLKATVPPSGKMTVNLPAKAVGYLTVVAQAPDGSGRTAKAMMGMEVVGPFEKSQREREEPEVKLKLDRHSYLPGQTIRAYVATNRPKFPMLLVHEGQDIWEYTVVPAGTSSRMWNVKTRAAMSPNTMLTASQWVDLQMVAANEAASLPNPVWALKVSVVPDRLDYRPGDTAHYRVTSLDWQGRPVPAETSVAVVDEAIYAIRPDNTPDLYQTFWGRRPNWVTDAQSAPEEISGGAYQGVARAQNKAAVPVRSRFEDTAFWEPFVETGTDGKADLSFEVPGNLTAWRATARALTPANSAGTAVATVKANREAMLRLATPRQMVQGDELRLIGTIDNRSADEHEFAVSLEVADMAVVGEASQRVRVPAKSQGKVEWSLRADRLPPSGLAKLTGRLEPTDATGQQATDLSDALQVGLRVAPRGVEERVLTSGAVTNRAESSLALPADMVPGAGRVEVSVWTGFRAAWNAVAGEVLSGYRYGSLGAAAHLYVATALGQKTSNKEVRECLAMLSRTQSAQGWGWWEDSPVNAVVTARVMSALGEAKRDGVTVYPSLLQSGNNDLVALYNQTNLWEHRAVLASALTLTGGEDAEGKLQEVRERGQMLSPYARLKMAQAWAALGKKDVATSMLEDVLKDASDGPVAAFVPMGFGIGWSSSETEATAECLATLCTLGVDSDLQSRMARWLVLPTAYRWLSDTDRAATVRALGLYVKSHPEAGSVGPVEVEVGGQKIAGVAAKVGASVIATLPIQALQPGENKIVVRRLDGGEALFTVEARVFRPAMLENASGLRVLRRYEARNSAGVWEEVAGAVRASEPVRCTVVVWGDDLNDAVRVVEPIPAGFEYIESERSFYGRDEVRDAAVIHYLANGAAPQVFRYYIRAESEGKLIALPASAYYVRRPATKGQSGALPIEVKGSK